MSDLIPRLRERHSFLCDEAAAELDRLNAQALELCAEISRLTRERDLADAALHSLQTRWANRATEQELRGLLARVVPYLDRGMEALHRDIAAALAGEPATEPAKTADQPSAALTRDAARYRWLRVRASQSVAYDRYGDGCHWSIGFFSEDSRKGFDAAVDENIPTDPTLPIP